jgi:hypothetical protein
MNAAKRFLALFRNSPTYGRDRASLISGFTIGITSLSLNAVMLMMLVPLMMDANDPEIRQFAERFEFGQLLALMLLGGATVFATFLIPFRLGSVFMAPRIGRYFDQIVLSGISPIRFLIGKVTSQNLVLALVLFLLMPWFVLVLALGGLEWSVFLANLFLVWLYCMMLSLVMLWLSLYLNEIMAGLMVIYAAGVMCVLGAFPFSVQLFVLTPFPALMSPVYSAIDSPWLDDLPGFAGIFLSCAVGMSSISLMALVAIYLGPLYGIIRDNSTFGEVVRSGDSRRKRWFRFRPHIQRPSEIAFFYENRGDALRRHEGLIRWGLGLVSLFMVSSLAWLAMVSEFRKVVQSLAGNTASWRYWIFDFHAFCHMFLGFGLVVSVYLFSHARNTVFQYVPVVFGRKLRVSRLDTGCFLAYLALAFAAAVGIPQWFDTAVAQPPGLSVFYFADLQAGENEPDYFRISVEGSLVLVVAGLTLYLFQRTLCLIMWLKTGAMISSALLYLFVVCLFPLMTGAMLHEFRSFREIPILHSNAERVALMSPMTVMGMLYREIGQSFGYHHSTLPFYLSHGVLICGCLLSIRYLQPRLLKDYGFPARKEIA